MLPVAYYLLKVVICSGILYGYYRLALHNKIFHRWNRFYLLAAVVMSLVFPLITINIFHAPAEDDGQVIRLLNVVTTGEAFVHDASGNGTFRLSGEEIVSFTYLIVSLVFLTLLFQTLVRLRNIVKHHYAKNIEGIHFVDTEAKGTPFSFFNYIFWNRNINIDSETGRKVFLHELAHVKEKHSADRLFMNIVMIFFWSNPFFWLIRREMNMIHEFIADSEAVDNNDTAEFAAMILQVAYPQRSFGLTSNFFSSSVKRRLLMLTKMQTPRTSYISRVLVLPLLAIVFVAFTIRTKQAAAATEPVIVLEKKLNVVIDAGHGGDDGGARSREGIFEKDLTLSLAKKIKELNANNNINIILTRSEDVRQPVKGKVDFARQQNADAFISIHVAAAPQPSDKGKGFEIYLSQKMDTASLYGKKARLLASIVTEEIGKTYSIAREIKQRKEKGIWVLDAEQINYPSILLECGYITDSKDLGFLTDEKNQEKVAGDILKAIERYADALEKNATSFIEQAGEKDIIQIEATAIHVSDLLGNWPKTKFPLLIINGKETKQLPKDGMLYASSPNHTLRGTLYPENNATALKKYGEAARPGAFIIEEIEKKQNTETPQTRNVNIGKDKYSAYVLWNGSADTSVVKMEAQKMEIGKWATGKPIPLVMLNGKETSIDKLENKVLIHAKSLTYPANHPEAIKRFGKKANNGVMILEAEELKNLPAQKSDTLKIKSIDVTNDGNVIVIYENNKAEKLTRQEAIKRKLINEPDAAPTLGVRLRGISSLTEPVYYIDEKEATKEELDQLKPNDIESIHVLKGLNAMDKYGLKAKHGAVEIHTKNVAEQDPLGASAVSYQEDKIFVKVEKEATFPGGNAAFVKYMNEILNKNMSVLKKENKTGTCIVRFVVNADGHISNVEAKTMKGTKFSEVVIDAIKNGPQWNPAMQNGKKVSAYWHQPVTFEL
ncbi:MAG: N-acetylmuramoyl-L-alanine amidase [Agriterribacter sp.]